VSIVSRLDKKQRLHAASVIGLLTSLAHSSIGVLLKALKSLRSRWEGILEASKVYLEGNASRPPFLQDPFLSNTFALEPDTSTFSFAVPEYWSIMMAAFTGPFRRLKRPFRLRNVCTEKKIKKTRHPGEKL